MITEVGAGVHIYKSFIHQEMVAQTNRQSTKICMASNLIARQTVTVVYSPPCTAITARQLHTYLLTYKLRCLSIKAYYYNSNVSRHSTVKTFRSSDEDTINPFAALHAGYFRRRK